MIKTKQELFALIKAGATAITPNNRLSNQLLHDYFLEQSSIIEDKPLCLPYQSFLRDRYNKVRHLHANVIHPLLLNQFQQRHLWREIINRQDNYPCNEGLIQEIETAWTHCQHWQVDMENPVFSFTPQTRQFQQWQQLFQQTLTQMNAMTEEQLADYLMSYKEVFNTQTVIWICFDDFTPQQKALQQLFDEQGCQQIYYDFMPSPPNTQCYAALDCQDEQLQMIEWLKRCIVEGEKRIGVVIPDLEAQYHSIQRLLQRHIPPEQFSISLGKPLTDYSLVTHALTWLGLNKTVIDNHQARLLLYSPYLLGAKSEFLARSQVMHSNKILQEANIPTDSFIHELNAKAPKLSHLLNKLTDYPAQATPEVWINEFKNRLIALGFPGEYPLNSSSYQCFQRFIGLFDEFLQLSIINPLMNAQTALDALYNLAKSTIFQTRQPTTPIQISGLLEASGCSFDSVWVCGLTDQCLPQKTKLSAFIPLDLQRDLQMPHAVATRELQFAQQLLQRLQRGSQKSVFSYPCLTGDMPNMPSPLIVNCPNFIAEQRPPTTATALCHYEEEYLLPLKPIEAATGGTSLLANQAKCPFRAFAAHRLHATSEPTGSNGPDLAERGQIIHRIMELLWKEIGSQQHLNAMTGLELNALIDTSIQSALMPYVHTRQQSFSPLVQDVELTRLRRLITACLDWEKQRPPFTIEALEKTFTIHLSGIEFRVRIDRMDQTSSGKKWVIDYKTSIPAVKPWNEERPEAPQLLLYALLDENINALLFLQLKAGRLTCSGLSEESLPLKGVTGLKKQERWSEKQQQWHEQLSHLASEFSTGFCPPKPNRTSTCEHCDFQNLCRIV